MKVEHIGWIFVFCLTMSQIEGHKLMLHIISLIKQIWEAEQTQMLRPEWGAGQTLILRLAWILGVWFFSAAIIAVMNADPEKQGPNLPWWDKGGVDWDSVLPTAFVGCILMSGIHFKEASGLWTTIPLFVAALVKFVLVVGVALVPIMAVYVIPVLLIVWIVRYSGTHRNPIEERWAMIVLMAMIWPW